MEELLADTSKLIKIEFNKKHKVNQSIRHLLDLKASVKDCFDDLLKGNKLQKKIMIVLNHVRLDMILCMDYAKFISQ